MRWGRQPPYAVAGVGGPTGAGRQALRGWLLSGVVLVGFAFAAVVVAAYYGATLGSVTTLFAILLAALPLGVVIPSFLWLDRFEAEPNRYLVVAFLWGALVAALVAGVF